MKRFVCALAFGLAAAIATPAAATFHLWDVSEVFTNADGSVQYIELVAPPAPTGNGQQFLDGHAISTKTAGGATLQSFVFPNNLPSSQTGGKHFLLATPGFVDVAGIAADYTIPVGFIEVGVAERIDFAAGFDIFPLAGLPTDGVNALFDGGGIGVPSPTNFAGEVGSIDLPEPAVRILDVAASAALLSAARRRRGKLIGARA